MTPSLGRGNEGQVFTEQDFIIEAPQTHVAYGPLGGREIESKAVRDLRNRLALGAAVTVFDSTPGLAEALSFDKPRRLNDHATDFQGLTDEDKDRIAEFWLVHAGYELHVWSLRLNDLSDRRATHEQQQEGEGDAFHRLGDYLSTLNLELDALKKIEFFFGQFVHAAGEVHRQDFLDELCARIDRQEWKQALRDRLGNLQSSVHIH